MPLGDSTWLAAFVALLAVASLAMAGYVYRATNLGTGFRDAGRRLGVSRWVALPAALVAVLGVASVFVLGGSAGRHDPAFVLATVVFVVGVAGLAVAVGNAGEYRRVRRTPTDAAAVDAGPVVVSGEAVPAGEAATTPFAGTEAVCYDWRVLERHRTDSDDQGLAVRIGQEGTPFYVDDGTGRVLVDPADADLRPTESDRVAVGAGERPPDRVAAFLSDLGVAVESERDRGYEERFLPAGAAVTVAGTARGEYAGAYPDDLVVGAGGSPLVAAGTAEEVAARFRRLVVDAGVWGLAATAGGYAGMLLAAGVL